MFESDPEKAKKLYGESPQAYCLKNREEIAGYIDMLEAFVANPSMIDERFE